MILYKKYMNSDWKIILLFRILFTTDYSKNYSSTMYACLMPSLLKYRLHCLKASLWTRHLLKHNEFNMGNYLLCILLDRQTCIAWYVQGTSPKEYIATIYRTLRGWDQSEKCTLLFIKHTFQPTVLYWPQRVL